MAKKVFVDGTIVIETSDFKYQGAGALCAIPSDANIIKANDIRDGIKCLVIDDKRPQSIFNEYYATGGFTTLCNWSYYLNSSIQQAYNNYIEHKKELEGVLDDIKALSATTKEILYKQLLLNVVTLFDTFVCETIMSKITSSEEHFDRFCTLFYKGLTNSKKKHFDMLNQGEKEQTVFRSILYSSYANVERVNTIYNDVYGIHLEISEDSDVNDWFIWRHRIVHRNGREKDGSTHVFLENDVRKALADITQIIETIMSRINLKSQE